MLFGRKLNETRAWPTHYIGDVVICASKRKMTRDDQDTMDILVEPPNGVDYKVPYGCALCVVRVTGCVRTESIQVNGREFSLGDYTPGRWAWRTTDLRPLKEPVPIVGRQGLWNLTPDEEKAVKAQL